MVNEAGGRCTTHWPLCFGGTLGTETHSDLVKINRSIIIKSNSVLYLHTIDARE